MKFQKATPAWTPDLPRSTASDRPRCERIFDDVRFSATRRKIKGALYHDTLRDGGSIPLPRFVQR